MDLAYCKIFLYILIHYFRLKIVALQDDDICTSERHQVDARFLEESLRTFHLFADQFRVLEMGYTGIRGTAGRREEGREGKNVARGRQKGVASVVGPGDLHGGIRLHLGDGYAFMHVSRLSHASCQ